jgi:outer membrane protein TolC
MRRLFIYFILLFPLAITAQQLTLKDAVNIALKKNFDIEIANNNVAISKINNNIGIAGGLPTVAATVSNQESITNINQQLNTGAEIKKNGAYTNNLSGNITGSMLLFNGYRVVATKQRLEELQKQNQQILSSQIQNTIAAVMFQYYNVLKQQSYLTTLQQSIVVSQKQLDIIEVKKDVGLANNADVFQSKIDLNTRQQDYKTQELVIQQSKADLLNVMSLKVDSNILVKDSIIIDNVSLDKILVASQQNADITSLDNQIKINELIEKETKAQRYPSIRANTGLNYGRIQSDAGQLLLNQSYGPFLGVNFSIPIYNGGVVKRQEQIANINTKTAKTQKQKLVQNYQAQIYKTFQSYSTTLDQIKSQQNTYELSQQLVQLVLQKFQLSQATILELNAAQKSFEDAAFRLTNLNYTAKIAEVELKRIANLLTGE